MPDNAVENWVEHMRVSSAESRREFIAAAKVGRVSDRDLIRFCELLAGRCDSLENRPPPEPREKPKCQCPGCSGMMGWFATCSGG